MIFRNRDQILAAPKIPGSHLNSQEMSENLDSATPENNWNTPSTCITVLSLTLISEEKQH